MQEKERVVFVDYIRVIACFLVMLVRIWFSWKRFPTGK